MVKQPKRPALKKKGIVRDAYGNDIEYEFQSVAFSEGENLEGYLSGLMNMGPANYQNPEQLEKINYAAEEFFRQNPQLAEDLHIMKDRDGRYNKTSLSSAYMTYVIEQNLYNRKLRGEKMSPLEEAYILRKQHYKEDILFSYEQLMGITPLTEFEKGKEEISKDSGPQKRTMVLPPNAGQQYNASRNRERVAVNPNSSATSSRTSEKVAPGVNVTYNGTKRPNVKVVQKGSARED